MSDYIKAQLEERVRAFESAKEIIDRAQGENRSLDATEQESVDRAMDDMDRRGAIVADMRALDARESEVRAAVANHAEARAVVETAKPASNDADMIRSLARGEIRSATFEKRDITKGSTGSPVPTSFLRSGDHACSRHRPDALCCD